MVTGGLIVSAAGHDAIFRASTISGPMQRVVLFLAIASAGLLFARRADLHLLPNKLRLNVVLYVALTAAVVGLVILCDTLLFRRIVPESYAEFIRGQSAGVRILYFASSAFNEEVIYRLFFMSAFAWIFGLWFRNDSANIPDSAYWLAIIGCQVLVVALNVLAPLSFNISPAFALYCLFRYFVPGLVWGYFYWRYGLFTAQLAHCGAHFAIQPIVSTLM